MWFVGARNDTIPLNRPPSQPGTKSRIHRPSSTPNPTKAALVGEVERAEMARAMALNMPTSTSSPIQPAAALPSSTRPRVWSRAM